MIEVDSPRCQLHSDLASVSSGQRLLKLGAALRQRVRLRSRLHALLNPPRGSTPHLGEASRFAAGSWVRVREPAAIWSTLDAAQRSRGLLWMTQQWPYCGTVHRVFGPVQRMMDDARKLRPISRTVLLDTVPCSGPRQTHGCGRDCPTMFRDEWLEEAPPPAQVTGIPGPPARMATVRGVGEILSTLDARGCCDGLLFMPEMARYTGLRFPVRHRIEQVPEGAGRVPASIPVYLLEGLHCNGEIFGAEGPCQRGCRLLWHSDWLRFDDLLASDHADAEHGS